MVSACTILSIIKAVSYTHLLIGADVLRDAAGLAGGDVRVADIVEQARLAVVLSLIHISIESAPKP